MLSFLLSLVTIPAAAAGPFVTVEYSPLSRGDITWTAEEQTSGLLVGEFDGFVNPSLKTHIGFWATANFGVSTSLGMARMQTTNWSQDNVFRQAHWGVVRPGLDLRYAPISGSEKLPRLWLSLGGYIDIASSRDVSNGYTESEQELASQIATSQVDRLRGMGSRIGFGIEKELVPGFSIGALSTLILHRATVFTETTQASSNWTTGDSSLLLTFSWPVSHTDSGPNDPENVEGIFAPTSENLSTDALSQ